MSPVRIVLADGGSLAGYPQGGGHWSCFLQYLFGLNALGHDVFWLEVLQSCGDGARDQQLIDIFFKRYGFKDRCALLLYNQHMTEPTLEDAHAYGTDKRRIKQRSLRMQIYCGISPVLYGSPSCPCLGGASSSMVTLGTYRCPP